MQGEIRISQHTGSGPTPHRESETGRPQAKLCKAVHTTRAKPLEKCGTFNVQDIICPGKNGSVKLIVKADGLENILRLSRVKGVITLRNFCSGSLLVLMLATNSFAAPAVAQSSVIPEPGLLVLLGGGLVGLATLIRRHLSD